MTGGTSIELTQSEAAAPSAAPEWWRSAVIYQVYPRSFADADGDRVGDLRGIAARLPVLSELGVDAVWLSPFYTSPQRDAGYDVADYRNVDPLFGTLDDFDVLLAEAHRLGLRLIIDLVPNHTSSDHPWFRAALAAGEGSEARDTYIFRDGKGDNGDQPPNNWNSVFGGSAWTRVNRPDGSPGQWYLHLFDTSQPDLNWRNAWVRQQFLDILRFWLDRGVDGFRIDVAHGLIKAPGLPDYSPPREESTMEQAASTNERRLNQRRRAAPPYWDQDAVHEIYRQWHALLSRYDGERALCGEAWVASLKRLARYVRPNEMQQTFNFSYLQTPWSAPALRAVIHESLEEFSAVGAPSTWVLSNHDVVRHATRLALNWNNPHGDGIGPDTPNKPDPVLGLRRARAATTLMLALPGSSYLYQGEELGLPEDMELPNSAREDPTWFRTDGARYGRDGCRVPIPWQADAPAYGFNTTGASWLPQPVDWARFARDRQQGDPHSTLSLYRRLLAERASRALGNGSLEWLDGFGDDVIAMRNGSVTVIANMSGKALELPAGQILIASDAVAGTQLPPDTAVWLS